MQLKEFTQKSIIITLCIWFLLYWFYPRYEFSDDSHRRDKISGDVEYHQSGGGYRGWHKY